MRTYHKFAIRALLSDIKIGKALQARLLNKLFAITIQYPRYPLQGLNSPLLADYPSDKYMKLFSGNIVRSIVEMSQELYV